jgi:hypothetical protein
MTKLVTQTNYYNKLKKFLQDYLIITNNKARNLVWGGAIGNFLIKGP